MYEQHHFVNGGITNAPFLHKKLRLIEKLNFWTFFEIKLISSEKRHVRVKLFSQKTQRITQCFLHSCENDICTSLYNTCIPKHVGLGVPF